MLKDSVSGSGPAAHRTPSADAARVMRLQAPEPKTIGRTDFLVVGSGLAGMTAALRLSAFGEVHLLSKDDLISGCTPLAQGGIASAGAEGDSAGAHREDTVICGAGLTQEAAAHRLAKLAPLVVTWLAESGVGFDRDRFGQLELGREGGHRWNRIVHAGGDSTGAAVADAMASRVRRCPRIVVRTRSFLLDLLTDRGGRAIGVSFYTADSVEWVLARAVILATGGFAGAYALTTNPQMLTGDGAAAALRAGAVLSDLEFVQFHPTALWTRKAGQLPLISEALRGEGAHLVDKDGRRYLDGTHPMAELAPRDVVARATSKHMFRTGADNVFLDARHLGEEVWLGRFPTILDKCLAYGIDPLAEPIPVIPAAHYCCGGIRTDMSGRTSVAGLYACGEVACTGVHGANRLASNSLLEAAAFAHWVAECAADEPSQATDVAPASVMQVVPATTRSKLGEVMVSGVGVLRSSESMSEATSALDSLARSPLTGAAGIADWETTNLLMLARAVTGAALNRTESRGCHYRSDFPSRDDRRWRRSITVRMQGPCMRVTPSTGPGERR